MRARGASCHDQQRGVGTVLARVLAHPGDRPLGIDLRCRKAAGPPEPIVRADAHPALTCEPVEQSSGLATLAAHPEVPAVEVDQHRRAGGTRPVAIQIESITPPGRAIADVRDPLHVAGSERQRPEHGPRRHTPAHRPTNRRARVIPPRPRSRLRARATTGPASSPRHMMSARPHAVRTARASTANPPGEPSLSFPSASSVDATSQQKAKNGNSLTR